MASFGISLSLDAETVAVLTHEAHDREMSVQELIRKIVSNYISMKASSDQ